MGGEMGAVAPSDRLAAIIAALRRAGVRVTEPRRAVAEALVEARGHVTAEDLAATVEAAHPGINRSTVYRTLDAFERLGVVTHVHLGHGRAVYHLADDVHPHLVCDECGAVIEVANAVFADLARHLDTAFGFTIRPHHFAVLGQCRRCRRTGRPAVSGR